MLSNKQKNLLREVNLRYSLALEPVAIHVWKKIQNRKTVEGKIQTLKAGLLAAITSALEDEREGVDFIEQDKEGLNN